MFFPTILAVYLLLNFYVVFRIKNLLVDKGSRIIFLLIYIVVVLVFPVTEILSHTRNAALMESVLVLGYLSLPFMLYLFLMTVLFDILRGLNRLVRIVPIEVLQGRRARILSLCLLLAIPIVIVVAGRTKFSTIRVNEYHVQVLRKSSPAKHLKIALASDFHLRELTDRQFMTRFVEQVNLLNADILLIPGDILEGDRQDGQLTEFEGHFREVRTRYGVYASLGNHEFYGRRGKVDFFQKSNITVLQDTSVVIDNAFTLVGRNDSHFESRMPISELMHSVSDSLPVIVLDHRPTDLERISASGADILVSGHTHGGQLFPLNYITDLVYEVPWGYKKIRNTHVFVTSGIQLWGPPVRTAGDSEIMLIAVDFTGS